MVLAIHSISTFPSVISLKSSNLFPIELMLELTILYYFYIIVLFYIIFEKLKFFFSVVFSFLQYLIVVKYVSKVLYFLVLICHTLKDNTEDNPLPRYQ